MGGNEWTGGCKGLNEGDHEVWVACAQNIAAININLWTYLVFQFPNFSIRWWLIFLYWLEGECSSRQRGRCPDRQFAEQVIKVHEFWKKARGNHTTVRTCFLPCDFKTVHNGCASTLWMADTCRDKFGSVSVEILWTTDFIVVMSDFPHFFVVHAL